MDEKAREYPEYPDWYAFEADLCLRRFVHWFDSPAMNAAPDTDERREWQAEGMRLFEQASILLGGSRPGHEWD